MKLKILFGLVGVALMMASGCVSKVSGGKAAGMPFMKDKVEGRYERSVTDVFEAAKSVIRDNGSLVSEGIKHGDKNEAKTIVGKTKQCDVYVRVVPVDATVTSVTVQTRTPGGGSDVPLAHYLEKEIALKLVR